MRRTLIALLFAAAFTAPVAGADTAFVAIREHGFDPDTIRVQPGDTVTWRHLGFQVHTVTGRDGETWDSHEMHYGDTYRQAFSGVGIYRYVCQYHPMTGWIVVGGSVAVAPSDRAAAEAIVERSEHDALGRKHR